MDASELIGQGAQRLVVSLAVDALDGGAQGLGALGRGELALFAATLVAQRVGRSMQAPPGPISLGFIELQNGWLSASRRRFASTSRGPTRGAQGETAR